MIKITFYTAIYVDYFLRVQRINIYKKSTLKIELKFKSII